MDIWTTTPCGLTRESSCPEVWSCSDAGGTLQTTETNTLALSSSGMSMPACLVVMDRSLLVTNITDHHSCPQFTVIFEARLGATPITNITTIMTYSYPFSTTLDTETTTRRRTHDYQFYLSLDHTLFVYIGIDGWSTKAGGSRSLMASFP